MEGKTLRLAALADVHCSRGCQGRLQPLFTEVGEAADVLLLCGDLTSYGDPEEMRVVVRDLAHAGRIPILAVLGNHDYEAGKEEENKRILAGAGVTVLDGSVAEVHGVGFAGVKGFGGGFGRRALQAWGEEVIKHFVHAGVEEALRLEAALARLKTPQRVVLLHYAPIQATVEGEPPEIYPFLGTSRLEEPVNRYRVNVVFHGHAHRGSPEGRTAGGVPVYNVAESVLRKAFPDRLPYRILELSTNGGAK